MSYVKRNTITIEDVAGDKGKVTIDSGMFLEEVSPWFDVEQLPEAQEILESLDDDIQAPITSVYFEENQDFLGIKITW